MPRHRFIAILLKAFLDNLKKKVEKIEYRALLGISATYPSTACTWSCYVKI